MTQAPRDPVEVVIRNLLTVHRFGNSLADLTDAEIERLFGRLAALIVEHDQSGPLSLSERRVALAAILEAADGEIGPTFERVMERVADALAPFAEDQADTATVHLRAILGAGHEGAVAAIVLTDAQLKAIVQGPITGAPLEAWFSDLSQKTRFQVERQLQLGLSRGETIGDLVRRIRGRAAGYHTVNGKKVRKYVGGVMQTTTRHARRLRGRPRITSRPKRRFRYSAGTRTSCAAPHGTRHSMRGCARNVATWTEQHGPSMTRS